MGQQYNVGEKSTVIIMYTYINHHAQLPCSHNPTYRLYVLIVHSYEEDNISTNNNVDNNSTIEPYKNRGLGNQINVGVYCTISLIAMHGYRTNTEYTRSLGCYNSVYRKMCCF